MVNKDFGGMLSASYSECIEKISSELAVEENFDVIKKGLKASGVELCFFYIDGFIKDGVMQRIMQQILSEKNISDAHELERVLPYVELTVTDSYEEIITAVLSGQAALLSESFYKKAIIIDARTYPARSTEEPDSDRVMQGSHDGFVETLIVNTALIRRRIRDPRLKMLHFNMGGSSKTDVAMCYVDGIANENYVRKISDKLSRVAPKTLTLGFQSLAESLIRTGWLNPFPKIRTTERPDSAAAALLEGGILVICDTSPQVMILPSSIFSYLEQADDYYYPPLTGTYLRLVRLSILLLSLVVTPLWYLSVKYSGTLPEELLFLVPKDAGALPILLQLILTELAIDGLKIASMNTPNMLSSSLSIIGALILGDFAVAVGWLCPDVILYMAFVAIANFAQQNHELGYAIKFSRILLLVLSAVMGIRGFVLGLILIALLVATNTTVLGIGHYLYPLLPFSPRKMLKLLFRMPKSDVGMKNGKRGGTSPQ